MPAATPSSRRDAFICHASEDKDTVARPLAEELRARGWAVWFDEFEMQIGDSLRRKIDEGLAVSRYGIVILSRSFFGKEWPERELDGLAARETATGEKVILPVWHEVDQAYVAQFSPTLADRFAANTARGIAAVADEIEVVLERRSASLPASSPPPAIASPAASSPSGAAGGAPPSTPVELRGQLVELLDAGRAVAVRELLSDERRRFENTVTEAIRSATLDQPGPHIDPARLKPLEEALAEAIERRLATLFPLIEHRSEEVTSEFRWIAGFAARDPGVQSNFGEWRQALRYPAWMLAWACGALASRERNYAAVAHLWETPVPGSERDGPLPAMKLLASHQLGVVLQTARFGKRLNLDWFGHLAFILASSRLVVGSYPELLYHPSRDLVAGALAGLADFSVLVSALGGRDGVAVVQLWVSPYVDQSIRESVAGDASLRRLLADQLFNVPPEDFERRFNGWLAGQDGPGP